MARCRARLCSLSLSLFPLKSLSRFEEVGVFISCAYLFCLCGKKNFSKFCCFSAFSRKSNATHLDEKRGKTNERKILNSLFIFRYKRTLLAITKRYKKEYRVLLAATRSTARNALRERDEEIIARGSHNCRREEKNIVVIFSKKISPSNAARGNQRRRRGRTKSSRERLTDDGAKEMEQRTRSIVRRRKFSEQCSF